MKKLKLLFTALFLGTMTVSAQSTAMDFEGVDCNGNYVHLFSDLEAGKAVVLFYYMPNCGSCPPPAQAIQQMAQNINATHPDLVKGYAYPFQNSTTCSYSASWVLNNNLEFYAPMDSGATQVAYYGGFGMPTVVLLGGDNHDVLWVTQDFNNADTTTMRNLVLSTFTASAAENKLPEITVYPNPSADVLHIGFEHTGNQTVSVRISDLSGKTVIDSGQLTSAPGWNTHEIDVTVLRNGNYLLHMSSDGRETVKSITIRR